MQEDHPIVVNTEEHSGDSVGWKVCSHLEKSLSHGSTYRHPDRPADFNRFDVRTDQEAILLVQGFEPFAHRFSSALGPVKECRYALPLFRHSLSYQKWYAQVPASCYHKIYSRTGLAIDGESGTPDFLYSRGEHPTSRRKALMKFDKSPKPTSKAMSVIG